MARLVSLPALTRAMLPEWQAHWQRSLAHWSGEISFTIGKEAFTLRISGTNLSLLDTSNVAPDTLAMTPQTFMQAIFGYRPIVSAIQAHERMLPGDHVTVLAILFPAGQTWIPASDWF
ncbi:GCN5-related N-acetyltransferase [Ktedonobacter racemifer DSM 44963]|uniref:GCN5-related N-acetyltransferase n=2 Tax=Ktedonobacter racemifer TaxID=363277 RepID=D6TTD0_KTERA|nr:GCN5-related N-acetyltransferase [Ktedonobacter racemifer DSM 44963]